jgi:hypothetical protein
MRDDKETVVLKKFFIEANALAAREALEAAGIPSYLKRGDASGWAPHLEWAEGIHVFVRRLDLERAKRIVAKLDLNAE